MTLRDYLRILGSRWRIIAICVVLGVLAGVGATLLTARSYQASAQLFVSAGATTNQTDLNQGNSFAQSRVKTYTAIVGSPDILNRVRDDLHITTPVSTLQSKITATTSTDQTIIDIQATDPSPAMAAALANSTARAFVTVIEAFETPPGASQSVVSLYITDPASAPSAPVSPRPLVNVLLGLFAGLLIGVSAAVLRDVLDNTVKVLETITRTTGAAPLGVIVADPRASRQVIAARGDVHSSRAENFRQLRTNLQFASVDNRVEVIAVTSAMPGEGKTMVALNLATTLADAGQRVVLVDADLRRPTIARRLGLVETVGLTNVLIEQTTLDEALQELHPDLLVLTSGRIPPNPSELLQSVHFHELIKTLRDRADVVVIDTAPLLPVADGAEVASVADGSLLVARYGQTTEQQARRGIQTLEQVDARLLGVVMNGVPIKKASEYGYAYYRTDVTPQHRRTPRSGPDDPSGTATGDAAAPEAPAGDEIDHVERPTKALVAVRNRSRTIFGQVRVSS